MTNHFKTILAQLRSWLRSKLDRWSKRRLQRQTKFIPEKRGFWIGTKPKSDRYMDSLK